MLDVEKTSERDDQGILAFLKILEIEGCKWLRLYLQSTIIMYFTLEGKNLFFVPFIHD